MGLCSSCFGEKDANYEGHGESTEISREEMRQRQLAAAEKRAKESADRGIGNQAKVAQWQKRQEAIEKQEKTAGQYSATGENPLRWQVN